MPTKEEAAFSTFDDEFGFTLTFDQFRQGIRLSIEETTGKIARCPKCGKRRLVTLPRDKKQYIACADSLGSAPACDFVAVQTKGRGNKI